MLEGQESGSGTLRVRTHPPVLAPRTGKDVIPATTKVPYMLPLPVDVLEYVDHAGHSPYAEWFNALNSQAAAKVAIAVTRIAQGNLSNVKGVGFGVYEYKIDFGPGTGFIW